LDLPRIVLAVVEVEFDIRQKINLVDKEQASGLEHVRVFDRLIIPLRYRQDSNFRAFAEIEHGRADEIADILDHED